MKTPDELLRLLRHDAQTGLLFWREGSSVARHLWGERALRTTNVNGYLSGVIEGKRYYAHRVVYALTYGRWPSGTIDHINGDKADNRPTNLRDVSHAENHRNMPLSASNTSGVVGVRWVARLRKWAAQIKFNGRASHLGTFATQADAIAARKSAERRLGFHPNHGVRHV